MRDLIAKIYRPDGIEHSGTAWLAAEKTVLTAFHCIEKAPGEAYPVDTLYPLKFESGRTATAILRRHDPNVDVALLELVNYAIPVMGRLIFGKLPRGEAWMRYRLLQNPTWECYGYPVGYELGLAVDGTITQTDAIVAGRISGTETAMQLMCEHGGKGNLNGLSGAAVLHNGNVVGMIRSGPLAFENKVIHAVSIERIAEVLKPVQKIVRDNFLHAVSIVAPNLLGVQAEPAQPFHDDDRRSRKPVTNLPRKRPIAYGHDTDALKIRSMILKRNGRYITIFGAHGIGKKTLVLSVASDIFGEFDGLFLVDLLSVQDERAVVEIANVLGVRQAHEQVLEETLIAEIGERKIAIIVFHAERLKHFESAISRITEACPNVCFVAVARDKFGWACELAHDVQELSLPAQSVSKAYSMELLRVEPSIQLFLERAKIHHPEFEFDASNASWIAELCKLAGGTRLAVNVVAVLYTESHDPEKISVLAKLSQDLQALSDKPLVEKHGALVAMVFSTLDPELQIFLCRLAIFSGGCTAEAAKEIDKTAFPGRFSSMEKLKRLSKKSLIYAYANGGQCMRYSMPMDMREYCLDRIKQSGELYTAARDHAEYYWRIVNQIERRITLVGGDDIPKTLEYLECEYSNIIAAFNWLRDSSKCKEKEEMGLGMAGNLFWFWNLRGSLHEGRALVEQMLLTNWADTEALGGALYCAGGLAFLQGDFVDARLFLTRSISVLETIGNERRLAYALVILGMVALHHGEPNEALWHEQRAVHLFEQTDNSIGLALASNDLANVLLEMGRTNEAEKFYLTSLKLWKDLNNAWGIGLTSSNLGHLFCRANDYDSAEHWLRDAMATQQAGRYQWGYAESIKRMGYVSLARQDLPSAAGLFFDSLALHQKIGRLQLVADCLDGLANIAFKVGMDIDGAVLLGTADAIRERIGVRLTTVPQGMRDAAMKIAHENCTRSSGNPNVFQLYLDQGKKLTRSEAFERAAKVARSVIQKNLED